MITRLLDETRARRSDPSTLGMVSGPWLSVLDSPAVPLRPTRDPLRRGILAASLILTLLSGILLIFNRYRPEPGPQPA